MELEIEKLARWIRATTYNCTGGRRWGSQSYHPKITADFPIEDFWLNLAREALIYQQERVDAALTTVTPSGIGGTINEGDHFSNRAI